MLRFSILHQRSSVENIICTTGNPFTHCILEILSLPGNTQAIRKKAKVMINRLRCKGDGCILVLKTVAKQMKCESLAQPYWMFVGS